MEEAITDQIVKQTQEYIDHAEGAGVGGTADEWVAQGQPVANKGAAFDESIVDIQTDEAAQFEKQKEVEAVRASQGTDGTQVAVDNEPSIPQMIQEIPQ